MLIKKQTLSIVSLPILLLGTLWFCQVSKDRGRRLLSGALHRHSGVVKNEQGSSHMSRRVRSVTEPTKL